LRAMNGGVLTSYITDIYLQASGEYLKAAVSFPADDEQSTCKFRKLFENRLVNCGLYTQISSIALSTRNMMVEQLQESCCCSWTGWRNPWSRWIKYGGSYHKALISEKKSNGTWNNEDKFSLRSETSILSWIRSFFPWSQERYFRFTIHTLSCRRPSPFFLTLLSIRGCIGGYHIPDISSRSFSNGIEYFVVTRGR
jgi:hypothetical protein